MLKGSVYEDKKQAVCRASTQHRLPYKGEVPSLIPRTHTIKVAHTCNPSTGEAEMGKLA